MKEPCLQPAGSLRSLGWIRLLAAGLLLFGLFACSDGNDSGAPPPPANTWDDMQWDEGQWALASPVHCVLPSARA